MLRIYSTFPMIQFYLPENGKFADEFLLRRSLTAWICMFIFAQICKKPFIKLKLEGDKNDIKEKHLNQKFYVFARKNKNS